MIITKAIKESEKEQEYTKMVVDTKTRKKGIQTETEETKAEREQAYLIDCMMFNAFSAVFQLYGPVHLSMLSWSFFF